MKSNKKISSVIKVVSLIIILLTIVSSTFAGDYYQIKVYNIKNADQETLVDNYLKNAYIPAMHRAGFKTIGVFKPIADDPAAGTKVFVLIPLKELSDVEKIEEKLSGDTELKTTGSAYTNAIYSNPPYERIESILLKAFEKHPDLIVTKYDTPKSEQIFELRSYQSASEKIGKKKVEMFNEGGEINIFKKLNANPVFFGEVLSGSIMPNLMYMTSYKNMESNLELWKAFGDDPDWKKLSGMEEYKNTVSHIDKWLLHPTDYSDI